MDGDLALRRLVPGDVPAAMALSQSAGWNQVPADWALFLDLGEAYGLFAAEDGLVGTACLMPYPPRLAWISLVIVHEAWRRRGLGSALLRHVLWVLAGYELTPLLDATPLGRSLYLRQGFRDLWGFKRYVRSGPAAAGSAPGPSMRLRPLEAGDLDLVATLDASAFGAHRDALLARLAGRLPEAALVAAGPGGLRGAVLGRDGRLANQLGPLVGSTPEGAVALLEEALARVPGPLQVDVPDGQARVGAYLQSQGCEPRRAFVRMILGDAPLPGNPQGMYAVAGAELG